MKRQRGGFVLGLVVGLLVGLALALGVALYVTKVPVPFVDKVPQRTAEQDAAEAERNKRWDPNGPLAGKPPVRPDAAPASASTASPPSTAPARDPASILAGGAVPPPSTAAAPVPAAPGSDVVASIEPFRYFVQVGAYSRQEDAEQQRARLAMLGFAAQVSERAQAGRTVYRVRLGPFDRKELADAAQERLKGNEIESALVRVER